MRVEDLNRRRRKIWFWGILALGLLFVLCVWFHSRSIPRDIEPRVRQALTTGGFDHVLLAAIDGRMVLLAGKIDGDVDRAALTTAAQSVRGVRGVSEDLELIQLGEANFSLKSSDGQTTLRGVLPDQSAVDQVAAAAARAYGPASVFNQLRAQSRTRQPGWLAGLAAVIAELPSAEAVQLEANPSGVALSGVVGSSEAKRDLTTSVTRILGDKVALTSTLMVRPPPAAMDAPQITISRENTHMVLKGNLADQASVDRLLAAAGRLVGTDAVVNRVTVGARTAAADWVDDLAGLLPALVDIPDAHVVVADERFSISGTVAAEEERSLLLEKAKTAAGDFELQDRIAVVQPSRSAHVSNENQSQVNPSVRASAPALTPPAASPEFPPLYHKHDSTDLVEASQRQLNEIVDMLKHHPRLRLEIAAHTDSAGDEVYNLDLSNRRAQDLAQILIAAGIQADRLIPRGYGESQPIADNRTPRGRAVNRRIELKMLE